MIILGIDPGLAHTGWGIIEKNGSTSRARAYGCITTKSVDPIAQRLALIHDGIVDVIETYHPSTCAIEGVFFGVNAKSAFALGQARGVAILATAQRGVSLGEYSPAEIKQAVVGSGRAEKEQIAYMVRALLNLDHDPEPDHCADALAIAITHAAFYNHKQLCRGE